MTRKLKVVYHTDKCIGAAMCTAKDPAHFVMTDENRAHLKGSKREGDQEILTITCDSITAERMMAAASLCPVSAIGVEDLEKGEELVTTEVSIENNIKTITAVYNDAKEFVLDPKGYFLIRTNPEKQQIEVGFCGKRNTIEVTIVGTTPLEVYQTILREKIIDRPDHAAYLGRELQKAYTALKLGIPYVQDEELEVSAIQKKQKGKNRIA
ncbi:DUF4346 domain-containing protein [Candidatus Woesearchaeota archaeon]|nr:DUF4346 domain-containing protein [Candidatus Woesearchaeota archaeon]